MPSLREIKRRIRGVQNIAQVTKAMQTVAAAKMRRAQEQALASRPYAQKAWEILNNLSNQPSSATSLHPLLQQRPVENILVIFITADRGLAGAYNANMVRTVTKFIAEAENPVSLVTVGKRGRDIMKRYNHNIVADFSGLPDRPSVAEILPIANLVVSDFLNGKVDEVYVAYTNFVNTVSQVPVINRLMPFALDDLESQAGAEYISRERNLGPRREYIYEPDPVELLDVVLTRFIEWQIYQAVLEAQASEHSARMVAMRSATDNATDLVGSLKLVYNRARQEAITKEMLDIAGGVEAQNQAAQR